MAISPYDAAALIGGIAALVVGISVAAPAQADDTQDQIFLTSLGNRGISCSSLPGCQGNGQLLGLGQALCTDLSKTLDPVLEVRSLVVNQYFSKDQATVVVGSAIGAYCPEHLPALDRAAGH
ncbi:DUF732 domain-containing protein [Mycolicibacterium fluoranthenivorans]|uniref:DUF732 domain-containing protein n=1 Tax=Mycolicibacterium fluoranthenivorans TaxID=258505 RepID=A0A1G4WQ40_9MYCO|nr:DUF732 domain-containing protein [Mycolicibacterium fluoranthenivorans]SCX27230.1 Protein of unknown function [Mycolicibacterium fluoranthenivorans]